MELLPPHSFRDRFISCDLLPWTQLTGWSDLHTDDHDTLMDWVNANYRIDALLAELPGAWLGGYVWSTHDMDYLVIYENEDGDGYTYTTTADYGEVSTLLLEHLDSVLD